MPQALVFDFNGVVFRFDPLALLRRELPQRAHDEASTRACFDSVFQGWGGDWAAFDRGTIEAEALVPRIAARAGFGDDEVWRVLQAVPAAMQPDAATVRLLRQLKAEGWRLFYLSNMPAPYARSLEAQHDFLGLFDDGVISARVQAIKPEPRIFEIAAGRFGLPGAELLFFDDVPANVQAARAAGWQAEHFVDAAGAARVLR